MISIAEVARTLGGESILKRRIKSAAQMERAISEGLPKGTLRHTVRGVLSNVRDAIRYEAGLVPPATFKRRKRVLAPGESEAVERVARVIATARHVWGDPEKANLFLVTPHSLLEGRRPLDAALTDLGARRVEDTLWQLYYGIPV